MIILNYPEYKVVILKKENPLFVELTPKNYLTFREGEYEVFNTLEEGLLRYNALYGENPLGYEDVNIYENI